MSDRSVHTEVGSVKYLFGAVVSLALIFGVISAVFWTGNKPTDLEERRGLRRVELREKTEKDETAKILTTSKAEWVNKEGGVARIPLSAAFDLAVNELKRKQPTPSTVKVDPVISLGADAPKMPSAPSGAATVKFSTIAPVPVKAGN